ncbi:MAG TPA: hypothetical protein VIS10_04540 [Anaerolineales bacterium]
MNALNRSRAHYPAKVGTCAFWIVVAALTLLSQAGCTPQQPVEAVQTPETQNSQITPATSIPKPTADLTQKAMPPALTFVVDNQVMEQLPGEDAHQVAEVPEAGMALDALRLGNTLLILREAGLQRVNLADGSSDMVSDFDSPVRFGELILSGDGEHVLYSAVADDASADFGWRKTVGIYSLDDDTASQVLSSPQNLRVLGLAADRLGLYLLPVGQDPDFGRLLLVELEGGEVIKELPVFGSGFAALAPDGQMVATMGPESSLSLYDLGASPPALVTYALPEGPSFIAALAWSPDSRSLYFLLNPGSPWDAPEKSLGLWRLDIASGDISQVAAIEEAPMHIRTLSPDGRWLLLEHESQLDALWIDLSSGESLAFDRLEAGLTSRLR